MEYSREVITIILIVGMKFARETIRKALTSDKHLEVISAFASVSAKALEEINRRRPNIVLLDVTDRGNIEAIPKMIAQSRDSSIVATGVACTDQRVVIACATAGVSGYITKDDGEKEWFEAIFGANSGEITNLRIAGILNRYIYDLFNPTIEVNSPWRTLNADPPQQSQLTRREAQVMSLIASGGSNKEIARQLNVELSTVKNHVHAILSKYRVRCRTQAAELFRKSGHR